MSGPYHAQAVLQRGKEDGQRVRLRGGAAPHIVKIGYQ